MSVLMTRPAVSTTHQVLAMKMKGECMGGWFTGTQDSLERNSSRRVLEAATDRELATSLSLSRDRGHHSSGWWKNADFEFCWHLSLACKPVEYAVDQESWSEAAFVQTPHDELRYWVHAFFGADVVRTWTEPGGTEPRLSLEQKRIHATMWHVRLFLNPGILNAQGEPSHPFMPKGEVYELTRWVDGLTPDKVDR